jgi:hypothetical protein
VPAEQWSALAREGKAQPAAIGRDVTQEYVVSGDKIRDITMSTPNRDRGRDTIALDGWKLDAFNRAKGPLLWCHDYSMAPIGLVDSGAAVEPGKRLFAAEATFLSESLAPAGMMPEHLKFAIMIGRMYLANLCRGFSIGMMPEKYAWNDVEGGVDFMVQELLELSCCPVGMNADCLHGAKSLGIDQSPWLHFVEKRLDGDTQAPPWMPVRMASIFYKALSAPSVQVPQAAATVEEAVRRAVGEATRQQAEHLSALARTVEALRAPPPAPATPSPTEVSAEQLARAAADATTEAIQKMFTRVTGMLPR